MDIEEIYRMYFTDVYRYIFKLSRSETVADEITSDTFFKAMMKLDSFREECDIRVWLCQIAKNLYFDFLKKTSGMKNADDEPLLSIPSDHASLDESLINEEQAFSIRKALHRLPEPYREVFMWRVFGELRFEEIGQIFHKSGNWACVTFHRACQKIKESPEVSNHEK